MAGLQGLHLFSGESAVFQKLKGDLTLYEFTLHKDGFKSSTISSRIKKLNRLIKLCNPYNPEEAKEIIAKQDWKDSTKQTTVKILNGFYQFKKIEWKPPRYKPVERLPFIPTEQEIDQLIASVGKVMATLLQTLKETGIRIGEAVQLKWADYNEEQRTLNITPEKGSSPRILPVSQKLRAMLGALPRRRESIFMKSKHTLRTSFSKQRKTASKKLQNPRLLKISFHTFRHWKGTVEYHKTKDIIHVKQILGHKDITSTMIYINIEQATFLNQADDFTAKVAHNETEAIKLVEAGFEFVCDLNGTKLFRKRK
jgi:integrase